MNGELHLLPLAVLRERGILDRTIRHELVHVMTDDVLGRRPLWVREGAAIYFAGERPVPARPSQRPGVQARAARVVSRRQRAAAAGIGRRAEQRLRAGTRVLREADSERAKLAGRAMTTDADSGFGIQDSSLTGSWPCESLIV